MKNFRRLPRAAIKKTRDDTLNKVCRFLFLCRPRGGNGRFYSYITLDAIHLISSATNNDRYPTISQVDKTRRSPLPFFSRPAVELIAQPVPAAPKSQKRTAHLPGPSIRAKTEQLVDLWRFDEPRRATSRAISQVPRNCKRIPSKSSRALTRDAIAKIELN